MLNKTIIKKAGCCAWKRRTRSRYHKDRTYYLIRRDERELVTVKGGSSVKFVLKDGQPYLEG